MTLSIQNPEADKLAHILTSITGETVTDAVIRSLEERISRVKRNSKSSDNKNTDERLKRIKEMVIKFNQRPVLDTRTPDEIIGFDENGLPT
ncbi:MAG: type II toxin-antitoxin system VapB family antitoxin [Rickettsiales bacterium]